MHAAGSAHIAHDASLQAAYQAIQQTYGPEYANAVVQHAQIGAQYAGDLTDAALHNCYSRYSSDLSSDPVERAKEIVEHMAPVLSAAADNLESEEGDCGELQSIIDNLRADIQPFNEEGAATQLTQPELEEVQTYAEQALGSTLERLMQDVMRSVQVCGPNVLRGDVPYEAPEQAPQPEESDADVYNQEDDTQSPDYEAGMDAAVSTAKKLVDSRAYVISNLIDGLRASLSEGHCGDVRDMTERARDDFNYFERTEMEVMTNMPAQEVEEVDEYAQQQLMPLLRTSLDEFEEVKRQCGREAFSDLPDEGADGEVRPTPIEPAAEGGSEGAEEEASSSSSSSSAAAKETALTVSAKAVIDHMSKDISQLIEKIEADPSDCQTAEEAGVEFKAKFKALEHIAEGYEERMSDDEKAQVEQYAEDELGSVMQDLFTSVMHTSAHCGPSAFSMDGGQDVEGFYEEQQRDTMEERERGDLVAPEDSDFEEHLPDVKVNPQQEKNVAQMKDRVIELKKRLEALRKKFDKSSGSGSGSGSGGSGSSAASAASGGSGGSAAASGSASAAASGSASAAAASTASGSAAPAASAASA